MIERRHLKINDLEISYLVKSSEDDPRATVVFIHGFPFSSSIWTSQLGALPEEVQGIAYDIRGFGNTHGGHSFYSIDLFARDLIDFLSALALEKVVLCGISMGGYIALRAWELSSPRIAGLILCDTNASADTNEGKLKRFASIEQVLSEGAHAFADGFIANLFSEKTASGNPTVPSFIHEIIVNTPVQTICSAQLALASRTDTTASLSSIDVPAMVIRGSDDRLMTSVQARELKEAIRGAELCEVPQAGHLPNCENTNEFNRNLNNYLLKHFLS